MLVVSPNPSFKLFTSLFGDNLNRVVHASDTHPFLRQLIDHGQSLASLLDNFMPAATIHVEDDRIGVAENGLVLRPTIEHKLDLDGRARFFQTIGENLNAGIELMHPGWVRTDMGGPGADIDTDTSVKGMKKVIDGLKADDIDKFMTHDGSTLPW